VVYRAIVVVGVVLLLSGCAVSSQKPSAVAELQGRVLSLEQRVDDQEKELVDIKYDVKEMAAALETETVVEPVAPALEIKPDKDISTGKSLGDSDGIIRVAVEVKTVQKALKNAGFYEGAIDGKIGPRTKNAIAAFQKQHGLTAGGIVGKKTWSEMKTYLDQ